MEQLQKETSSAAVRLRCIRQVAEADEETLGIVSSVLDRVLPATKSERKKRGPRRRDEERGGQT